VVSKGKGKIACIDLWPWIIADQTCPNQLNSLIHLPILTTYHVLNYSTIDANLVRKAPILLAKILTPILDKILNNAQRKHQDILGSRPLKMMKLNRSKDNILFEDDNNAFSIYCGA